MKLNLATASIAAVLSLAACNKNSPAGQALDHANTESEKEVTKAQLEGQWVSACLPTGLTKQLIHVQSQKQTFNFYNNAGETVELFSDANCQTSIGSATYTGPATVGTPSAVDNANVVDLNYTNVSVVISNQSIIDGLDASINPVAVCGSKQWVLNQPMDVTVAAAQGNSCPIDAAVQDFDILKTDGTSLHFGLADAAHDRKSDAARPIRLDTQNTFTKVK